MKACYSIDLQFFKKGLMRYISHLDLLRLFHRACRRARLPLEFSRGFSPHPLISIYPAIKLGLESDELFCRIGLNKRLAPARLMALLNRQLPEGIKAVKAQIAANKQKGIKT